MTFSKVLINGEIINMEQATTSIFDRGYQFGDGVAELVPVYNGRCFGLLPHMEDFFSSVIAMKLPGIYTMEELVEFHEEVIRANNIVNGEIYTQLTRGEASYGLDFPEMTVPKLAMQAVAADRAELTEKQATGVNIITETDNRWLRCDVNTLNKLPEVLAKQKARVARAYDALFVRENGIITESTESNFFVVKDDLLWTHPANNLIRNSVSRRLVKERLAVDLGLQVIEKAFNLDFVLKSEEAFLVGPRIEIIPVTKIDRQFIEGGVGQITRQLIDAYKAFIARECPPQTL
ncbi:MAG TPA: aminotransferase class IV [Candidatus Dorea intestinavium]|nr:aminotransferase class IV [Candidatus Dorea intestinavium]